MKKYFSIAGMIASVLVILFGILAVSGALGDADSYGGESPYDSGYASFGGDYYTYSVNNSAETTSAVNAVASNLREISDILRNSLGLFMIGFGLLSLCGFGILYSGCIVPVEIPVQEYEENNTEEETAEENQEENTVEEVAETTEETTEENL